MGRRCLLMLLLMMLSTRQLVPVLLLLLLMLMLSTNLPLLLSTRRHVLLLPLSLRVLSPRPPHPIRNHLPCCLPHQQQQPDTHAPPAPCYPLLAPRVNHPARPPLDQPTLCAPPENESE